MNKSVKVKSIIYAFLAAVFYAINIPRNKRDGVPNILMGYVAVNIVIKTMMKCNSL